MKSLQLLIHTILLLLVPGRLLAQVPTCGTDVPYNMVDLSGTPDSIWLSPGHSRTGNCCGTSAPDRCTSFEITLDSQAAMVNFEIATGAVPPGSMFYQIGCGTPVPVGQAICITGTGPHHMTFCKPGNNTNTYRVMSIPRPIFPKDDSVRIGCSEYIRVLGLDSGSITWTSVYPGTSGQYNSYLSQNDLTRQLYTPGVNAPAYIDYQICGHPIAAACGYVDICDTVRIYNISPLTATISPTQPGFCQGGSVTVTASASGGAGAYSYIWKNSTGTIVSTSSSYTASISGNYTLEVRDAMYNTSLCPGYLLNVPVKETLPPVVNAGPDQTLCPNTPTVYLSGTVTNSGGGVWSGGNGTFQPNDSSLIAAYTPTLTEIGSGSVTLTLTSTGAGGGCANTSDAITITYPSSISISLASQALLCFNDIDTLVPSVSGGVAPYQYNWNNGDTTLSTIGGQGSYCLYVTDANGCQRSACANITTPTAISLVMSSTDNTVNGGSTGTASVTASGGTTPYSYLWSNGGTNANISGLPYGVYTVTVTDGNGCTATASVVVNEPRCLGLTATVSNSPIQCYGGLSTVVVTPSGGTSPYTYYWNTGIGQTNDTVTVPAGSYSVVITDSNGCVDITTAVITEPTQLINTMTHTNVAVAGDSTGTATATPSGGTSPYSYSWSNGATTSTITGLPAGVYSVTITDSNDCSVTDVVFITQPPCNNLLMGITSTNVSCANGANGTASAHVFFGTPPYVYSWSNSSTTSSITNLVSATYAVTVTDSTNCLAFQSVTITQPSALSIALAPTDITCFELNNGTIELSVSGGTPPYSFNWSNGIHVEDQANLSDGTYSVTVTDANGCTSSGSAIVNRPSKINVAMAITNTGCFGYSNGAVDATISGGIAPYTFSWSNGSVTEDLSNLTTGSYILTVTDANYCQLQAPAALVDQPDSTHVDSITVDCPVPNSGVAQVTISAAGGNGSYSVSYNNGLSYGTSGDLNEMLPVDSTYYIIIKDSNNCTSLNPYTVDLDPAVTISNISYSNCFAPGTTTTGVTVTPAGGAGGPYTVSYDNGSTFGVAGTYTATLAIADTYYVVVKDTLGCLSKTDTIIIPSVLSVSKTVSAYMGGYNVSCNGSSNGSIDITPAGGTAPYTYSWSNAATTQDVTNVAAGSYIVTVTDTNGCTAVDTSILTQPALLLATASTLADALCNGNNNGSVTVAVSGGTTPYHYSWNSTPVQLNDTASGLGAGSYIVTVTDTNGCIALDTTAVTQPSTLAATASTVEDVLCYGGNNGKLTVATSGGTQPYNYSWNSIPVQTNDTAFNLAAGSYTVTVTDSNGCTVTSSASVTQPAVLAATASTIADVQCNGGSNGSVTVAATGGTTPYSYNWNSLPVQTNDTATNLTAGNYIITVTDDHGCTATDTVAVTQPTTLTANSSTITNVLCNGGNNGSATVTAGGGTAPYNFSWNSVPVQTNDTATNLAAGSYIITVTDDHGCTALDTSSVTQPSMLTVSAATITNVLCFGGNNGSVTAVAAGGTTPYTYSWNSTPIQANDTANSLTAGNYVITVTDDHGCTALDTTTVTQPILLTANASTITDVLCFGGNNGSVTVSAAGGTTPYSYSWNSTPIQTTATANNLTAGSYIITITDDHGCTALDTTSVSQPALLTASASTIANVLCFGGSNGSVTVSPAGGTTPYSYSWNSTPVQTTATATALVSGTYIITLTDDHGCTAQDTTIVTQPALLTANAATIANVLCFGGNNGSVTVVAAGGTTPYNYSWNSTPIQTNDTATSLTAGNYIITVTDDHGCTVLDTTTITQPTLLTANASTVTDVLCFGGNNGSVTVSAAGGTTPYNYSWNSTPIQTTATATNLTAGTYIITVTDDHGCTALDTTTVLQPAVLSASASTLSDLSCNGNNDGSATVAVTGGTMPYSFNWNSTPVQTDDTATNLPAGSYIVTVTDDHGCTAADTTNVVQPPTLSANAQALTNVLCNGGANGSASVTVNGGTTPYSYYWNTVPVQTTDTATNLPAGTYIVTVTDNHNCIHADTVIITEPTVLNATASTIANALCYGNANGSATVSVNGGTTPYAYNWNSTPVQTTATAGTLQAGTYVITITDDHGCIAQDTTTITQPAQLTANASTIANVLCFGGNNGSVTVAAAGGTLPYSYNWNSTPVQTDDTATGLVAGSYIITITDDHGCTILDTTTVIQPQVLDIAASTLADVLCFGGSNGSVTAVATGGTTPYSYSWNSTPVQTDDTATGLEAGIYTITVTDDHGCTAQETTAVNQPTLLTANAATLANVLCFGGNNGSVTVVAAGGTTPYNYSWNSVPVQANDTASNLVAGSYIITVTDDHGCTTLDTTTVTQPTVVTANASTLADVLCYAGNNGSVTVAAAGGTIPYSYSWNSVPIQTNDTATNLPAGNYVITVTDDHGCTALDTATVTQPTELLANASTIANALCSGSADGSLTVTATGGTLPYSYSWNSIPVQQTATATGLTAGTYTATITDDNGCTTTASATITEPNALVATATTLADVSCFGGNNGSVTVTAGGGTQPYSYSWNTLPVQVTANATGLGAGSYVATITDGNGCTARDSSIVNQPALLIANASTLSDILCSGGNTGSVTATVTGGTTPYTYNWNTNPVQTTATANGLGTGTYTVLVTDTHGCTAQDSTTVGTAQPLVIDADITNLKCFGDLSGSIDITVTGGNEPYTYNWSHGGSTQDLSGLPAGTYTVTVTDAASCSATENFEVTQPDSLKIGIYSPLLANGYSVTNANSSDGSITLTVDGGTLPYTFLWSNGSAEQNLVNIPAGYYQVAITDLNGCTTHADITLTRPTGLEMPTGYSPNNDGQNDYFVVHGIENYPLNNIKVFNRWGDEVYSKPNYQNTWGGENNEGKQLPDGTYFVILKVRSSNGNGHVLEIEKEQTLTGYVDIRR